MTKSVAHPLRGLLIAQFFGAFNDNAWKLMVALLAIGQATRLVRIEACVNRYPILQPGIATEYNVARILLSCRSEADALQCPVW